MANLRKQGNSQNQGGETDHPPQEPTGKEATASRRVALADTVSEAALAVMLGVLGGQVPLKHARVATGAGELCLRGLTFAEEYGERKPIQLPDLPIDSASGDVVKPNTGTAREV